MKSTVATKAIPKENLFPGLYTPVPERNKIAGLIVLMHEKGKGIVVHGGYSNYEVGTYLDYWAADSFEPYHGAVTIEN